VNAKIAKLKATIIPKAANPGNTGTPLLLGSSDPVVAQIQSAKTFTDLSGPFKNAKAIRQFRATCYHAWMPSADPFDDFALDPQHC
jgi:hypothetical protein